MNLLARFENIDRRIIYLLLLVAVAIPQFVPLTLPMYVMPQSRGVYDAIERMPDSKIALVLADWDSGTRGENAPQTEAVLRHLMLRGKRFAVLGGSYPQGPGLTQDIAEGIQKEYGRAYGKDWCNLGYSLLSVPVIKALGENIPKTLKKDIKGTPIEDVPAMHGITGAKDLGLIIQFTGSGGIAAWIDFIWGPYRTPIAEACTAIIAPAMYRYLDSGQLVGLLFGMKGAAEYEKLVQYEGLGTRGMKSQSLAFLLIMGLFVLANLSVYASRRKGEHLSDS